jgi:SAM-dependent methyltransferase
MDGPINPALHEHYARGEERDRLMEVRGMLEFERTTEIVLRQLPAPPSVVADIGGGPGRAVGDARDLDLDDSAADAVLLLGPIYHLRRRDQRLRALREAWRVVRPGGPVFVAAISRWASRLDGELRLQLYKSLPTTREQVPLVERTGWMPPLFPGSFSAYCHRPQQLRAELSGAGFRVLDLVAVEGMGFVLHDLDQRLADPLDRAVVLDATRATERVPELLGIGPHLLATAVRPER